MSETEMIAFIALTNYDTEYLRAQQATMQVKGLLPPIDKSPAYSRLLKEMKERGFV